MMKTYAKERRDASEFFRWRREMDLREAHEKVKQVELRKLQLQNASEDVSSAKVKKFQQNKSVAFFVKQENEKLKEKKETNMKEEEQQRKATILVRGDRENLDGIYVRRNFG